MHQHPRAPPPSASPANSERTNPERTNNQRDRDQGRDTPPAENYSRQPQDRVEGNVEPGPPLSNSSAEIARLNQVIQNFHTKAALIILHTRFDLAPAYAKGSRTKRLNKWFNVELDETEEYRDEIRLWKTCDHKAHRPPPLVIEVLLNTDQLTSKQSLVIHDIQGKRWDVQDALTSSGSRSGNTRRSVENEVILERWTIQLGEDPHDLPSDLNVILPLVYKKSIVLFRSLFTYSAFLPAWKLSRKLAKMRSHSNLKLQYRIFPGTRSSKRGGWDTLTTPLYQSEDEVVTNYSFGTTESPAGPFSVKVTYRSNCEFAVDDSESLLSSRFMGTDEELFRPSLAKDDSSSRKKVSAPEVGSLPNDRRNVVPRPDPGQAYGSLSTFHQIGPASGTSPITALRNAQDLGSSPPAASPPGRPIPTQRSNQSSRSSLRSVEGNPALGRRTSISFQPFKTQALSASPSLMTPAVLGPSSQPVSRTPSLPAVAETQAMPPPAVPTTFGRKITPNATENAATSASSPAAPVHKYTSSFSHRRSRLSSGSVARTEDDQGSSGKASAASSGNQPNSGVMANVAPLGNTASVQEDDENISDFLKMLESKKDLLTPADSSAVEASTRRTATALNRFHRMRDSNAALSDSMSLSLQRSSSSSSRHLSSLPPMVAATSLSTSSSPSKPVSPHTPHTPAIPSRLSANSTVEYGRRETAQAVLPSVEDRSELSEEAASEVTVEPATSHVPPIDIPTSPRIFVPSFRRSSSAAQRRVATDDDDVGELYGMRSASMGAYTRTDLATPVPTAELAAEVPGDREVDRGLSNQADAAARRFSFDHQRRMTAGIQAKSNEGGDSGSGSGSSSIHHAHRSRLNRGVGGVGRGATPLQGSESGSSSTFERRGGSRQSFSRPSEPKNVVDEDEPLFFPFAISDIGASRRSIEEARLGQGSSASERDRGADGRRGNGRKSGYQQWGA